MRSQLYFLIILFLFFNSSYAYQHKAARDNETIKFYISDKEYSRIFVTSDRIKSIKGQNNLFEIKEFADEDDGVLFIRPTTSIDTFITLFITTELGHHYTLMLKTKNCVAENIEIKPLSSVPKLASKWEQNIPYAQTLVDLLRIMVNRDNVQGYSVIDIQHNNSIRLANGLKMQLIRLYQGSALRGEVWFVENTSRNSIILAARNFYKKNVRAISIAAESINPYQKTLLYRIAST